MVIIQERYRGLLLLLVLQTVIMFVFCSFSTPKDEPKKKVKVIVIDPGHGGKDPGCSGVSCKEKEVALAVALRFGKLIEENMKDVKVIFTRKTDVFVELEDRAKIANDNNADLFISIHCNAAGKPIMIKDKKTGNMRPKTFKNSKGKVIVVETSNPEPYGAETYVMGLKNEEGKMKVAQRENSAMLLEDNYQTKYKGFDPNSEESYIIMSNYTSDYVLQSAGLALKIQEQYSKKAGRVDKGVHRQSIWVLWRTSMPSVLTEIGYLTNPQEEKFLGSEKGQAYLGACLFRAFRKYKDEQEGVKLTYNDDIENQMPLERETYQASNENQVTSVTEQLNKSDEIQSTVAIKEKDDVKARELVVEKERQMAEIKEKEKLAAEQKIKLEADRKKAKADSLAKEQAKLNKHEEEDNRYKQYIAMADINFKNKKYEEAIVLYQKAQPFETPDNGYASIKIKEIGNIMKKMDQEKQQLEPVKQEMAKSEIVAPISKTNVGIVFKVQFASSDKQYDVKTKYTNVSEVSFYQDGLLYKYTSGSYSHVEDAIKQQVLMRELGYKDCFVVAFNNGIRITVAEAKKIIQ